MSILKQWYLRLFKGWILTDELGKRMIEFYFLGDTREITFVHVKRNRWLISPPRGNK